MLETAEDDGQSRQHPRLRPARPRLIGPAALALALGYARSPLPTDTAVLEAIETIRANTKAANKVPGIHCGSASMTRVLLDGGFDLATLLTDTRMHDLCG